MRKVYLAGDIVFRPEALAIFEAMKAVCAQHNLLGVAPFDGQEEARHLPPGRETILAFVRADRALMDECDAGLFCVDPFRRAADMDPGTAVEIGYMHAQNKPLEGYTVDGRLYPEKVADYWMSNFQQALTPRKLTDAPSSGALEDPDGMLVHSEGMLQNGMVDGFIEFSGGRISVGSDFMDAFSLAAKRLSERIYG